MKKLNVAIIGCGNVSKVHFPATVQSDKAVLRAACDVKPDRAEAAGKKYGVPHFIDYRDVLELELDAIHICTPHHTHAEIAKAALNKGIHVLTEKPMAISLAEADEMIACAQANGLQLGVIFQNRYNASSQAVKKAVTMGELGRIKGARAYVTWYRPDDYYSKSDWKGTWDKEGGGVLIDQAIHTLDLLQWVVGDIDAVEASIDNRTHELIDVEDVAEATVYFKNGTIGNIYATNYYTYDADVMLEVHGENGRARVEKDDATIEIEGQDARYVKQIQETDTPGKSYWGVSHQTQIEAFYDAVLTGKPLEIDGREGRKALELVRAIYYSGNNGRVRVPFPFDEPHGFMPKSLTR